MLLLLSLLLLLLLLLLFVFLELRGAIAQNVYLTIVCNSKNTESPLSFVSSSSSELKYLMITLRSYRLLPVLLLKSSVYRSNIRHILISASFSTCLSFWYTSLSVFSHMIFLLVSSLKLPSATKLRGRKQTTEHNLYLIYLLQLSLHPVPTTINRQLSCRSNIYSYTKGAGSRVINVRVTKPKIVNNMLESILSPKILSLRKYIMKLS